MTAPLRSIAAALLLLAPSLPRVGVLRGGAETSRPLLATLRARADRTPTPAWLERAVCEKGSVLGEACGAVAAVVAQESHAAGLDPVLVLAIIDVESGWDPDAVSSADAHGLMQLLVSTLADEAAADPVDPADAHDPVVNVRVGIRFYGRLVRQFADPDLAMVAYNAGPGRVSRYLRSEQGIPDRLWVYPRAIRRAEARLRAQLEAPVRVVAAADTRLALP